jgi:hypothetical protein
MERRLSLEGASRRTKQDRLTRIYDLGATENGIDLSNALIDSLAEDGDPVVHIVKTCQSIELSLVLTELAHASLTRLKVLLKLLPVSLTIRSLLRANSSTVWRGTTKLTAPTSIICSMA